MSENTDTDEIEQLREQTQTGSRAAHAAEEITDLEAEMQAAYEDLDEGSITSLLSFRDEYLAGLVRGLESDENELHRVIEDLQAEIKRDIDVSGGRSDLLRLAIRVGLQEADPDLFEQADEAYIAKVRNELG